MTYNYIVLPQNGANIPFIEKTQPISETNEDTGEVRYKPKTWHARNETFSVNQDQLTKDRSINQTLANLEMNKIIAREGSGYANALTMIIKNKNYQDLDFSAPIEAKAEVHEFYFNNLDPKVKIEIEDHQTASEEANNSSKSTKRK